MHLREYAHHHVTIVAAVLFCAWLSLSLILRMWLKYRNDSFLKKAGWSLVLCVPFFGWLFYCGFYTPVSENNVRAESNPNIMGGAQ